MPELPDIPLEVPLEPPPSPHRRSEIVAPAPRWVAPVYLGLAVLLLPWIVYLGVVLPDHTTGNHWDVAWVGFDLMEFTGIATTAWLAYARSTWVELSASVTAALLFVDAWFDVTTASGWHLAQAIGSAVVLELPLAGLSIWIARHAQLVNDAVTHWLVERSSRQAERLSAATSQTGPRKGQRKDRVAS